MTKTKLIAMAAAMLATTMMSHAALAQVAFVAKPGIPPSSSSSPDDDCAEKMGHMRRVSAADIQAIHPGQYIGLIVICADETIAGRDNYGDLFIRGNVDRLRVPLANNPTIMAALQAENYDEYDVISLRYGMNDSILLYVHQRYMHIE